MDPVLKLTIAMEANPGVYALLLGSGVSRSAGVPSGWDITLDLIRKVARLQTGAQVADPEQWYSSTYKEEPDYSRVLERLSPSAAERSAMLRAYFEASEQDRADGRKVPTPAHHAIARLIQRGSVRVVLTTNFDRLLEQALETIGIVPQVISSPDMAKGAPPLVHAKATIIKLHGDYLDLRIKNTTAELNTYDPAINVLLDQVLDEYGLIVCGWSGEWDGALRAALERCPSRRYGVFWTGLSKPTGHAERLIRHRAAEHITVDGADTFFDALDQKLQALNDMSSADSMTTRIAAAAVKRYVVDPASRIRLHDLLSRELQGAILATSPAENPLLGTPAGPDWKARLRRHEAATATLRAAVVTIVQWGSTEQQNFWEAAVKSLARERSREGGLTGWIQQRRYAALLLAYAVGVTATGLEAWTTVLRLWKTQVSDAEAGVESVGLGLSPTSVLQDSWMQQFFGEVRRTPTSDYLHSVLREDFRDCLPDDADYDATFDRFECLWSLHLMCQDKTPLIGRYMWRRHALHNIALEMERDKDLWAPFRAGLFDQAFNDLVARRNELQRYATQIRLA